MVFFKIKLSDQSTSANIVQLVHKGYFCIREAKQQLITFTLTQLCDLSDLDHGMVVDTRWAGLGD